MDGETEVACVSKDSLYTATDDITVTLNGDKKSVVFLNGADYTLRIVGTDTGTMDVTDIRYSGGVPVRTLEYNDLPVTARGEYRSKQFALLQDDDGNSIPPDCDSQDSPAYTLSVISGQADAASVRAGQNVSVSAVIPEGYAFAGWLCDREDAVLDDPDSPVTTLRMPAGNVTLTAQLKVMDLPEERLTLTDPSGLVYREIPQTAFDLQLAYSGSCIVATYDTNGKLLSASLSTSSSGTVCVSLDNGDGLISKIMLFRIFSPENPAPAADPLQISRQ